MQGDGGGLRRRWRGAARVVALVPLATLAMPSAPVSAHAIVEEVSPADGTLLASAPPELRIRFSEPISDQFIEVSFLTSSTAIDEPLVGTLDGDDPSVLVVTLPPLDDGLYQVGFEVRDREDLHEVRGRTSFSIGDHAMAAPSAPPAPPPQPFETMARWLFAVGLALLVGAVLTRGRWPDAPVARPERLVPVTAIALAAAVGGRVGVVLARAHDLHVGLVDGLSAVARTSDVARLPVLFVAALCAVPLLVPRRFASLDAPVITGRSITIRVALGWMAVVWLAVVASWGDHAALQGDVEPAVALAKATHLIGLGVWIGVVVVTLVVNAGSGHTSAALGSWSRVAVVGAVITVASGFVLASRMVVSITGLFATAFGQLLVLKLLGITLAVAAGLAHRRFRRALPALAEATALVGVVLLGASMATSGPAVDDAYLPAPAATAPGVVNGETDDIIVRLRAIPAQPGPNDLELAVVQTRRPVLAPVTEVVVTAMTPTGPAAWTVSPDDRGAAVVSGVQLAEGSTDIGVALVRPSLPAEQVDLELTTVAPRYHRPVIVSSQPIRTPLLMLALAAGLLAVVVIVTSPRHAADDRHRRRYRLDVNES
jgi:copper transport protein